MADTEAIDHWEHEYPVEPEVRMARIEFYLAALGRLVDGLVIGVTWTEPDGETMFYPSERGNGYMVSGILDELIAHHDPDGEDEDLEEEQEQPD